MDVALIEVALQPSALGVEAPNSDGFRASVEFMLKLVHVGSTIMETSCRKPISGDHLSIWRAFEASARSSSTSAGRKYRVSMTT